MCVLVDVVCVPWTHVSSAMGILGIKLRSSANISPTESVIWLATNLFHCKSSYVTSRDNWLDWAPGLLNWDMIWIWVLSIHEQLCWLLQLDWVHLESFGQFGLYYKVVKIIRQWQWQSKREEYSLGGDSFHWSTAWVGTPFTGAYSLGGDSFHWSTQWRIYRNDPWATSLWEGATLTKRVSGNKATVWKSCTGSNLSWSRLKLEKGRDRRRLSKHRRGGNHPYPTMLKGLHLGVRKSQDLTSLVGGSRVKRVCPLGCYWNNSR